MQDQISVIIPCYNEALNIQATYKRIITALQPLENYTYEIIFIDNASIDDSEARNDWGWKPEYNLRMMTTEMLEKLKEKYNNIKLK